MNYVEATQNNRISKEERLDGIGYRIEQETNYDIIGWDGHEMDITNRLYNDGNVRRVNIYNKTLDSLIEEIRSI